jgi:hypothetical protein
MQNWFSRAENGVAIAIATIHTAVAWLGAALLAMRMHADSSHPCNNNQICFFDKHCSMRTAYAVPGGRVNATWLGMTVLASVAVQ